MNSYFIGMNSGAGGVRDSKAITGSDPEITISDDVREYLVAQPCNYRVCTSCGGPILLPVSVKRPKTTDIAIPVGERTLYISQYQAPFLGVIGREMMPRYLRRHDR